MMQIAIEIVGPPPPGPRAAPISVPAGGFDRMIELRAAADPEAKPLPPAPAFAPLLPPERQDVAGGEDKEADPAMAAEDEKPSVEPIWLPTSLTPPIATAKLRLGSPAREGVNPVPATTFPLTEAPLPPIEAKELEPAIIECPAGEAEFELRARAAMPERLQAQEPPVADVKSAPTLPPAAALPAAIALQPIAQLAFMANASEPLRIEPAAEQPMQGGEPGVGGIAPASGPTRVEAPSQARDAGVDTSRGDWIETMIERIDTMREESGDRSAQIRLRPDALGAIDVRIRHQGDQVHINFAAESAAARALLSDAAPRLAELAEARGLRLGDSGVGQGFGGDRRADPQQIDARVPNRAPRAASSSQSDRSAERIA